MRQRRTSKKDVIIHWIGVVVFSAAVGSGIVAMGIYGILKETQHKFYIVGENK